MTGTDQHRHIGKFELHELIGEGAMGAVWKAYDSVIRRYVAGAAWSMLTVLTSGLTFLYVAFRTLGGTITVGGLTLILLVMASIVSMIASGEASYEQITET